MESDEHIEIDGVPLKLKKDKDKHDLEQPVSALAVLDKVNKAYFNRPSAQKKRLKKKQLAQLAEYFKNPSSRCKNHFKESELSDDMAAIIIQRAYRRRRLIEMRNRIMIQINNKISFKIG